MIPRSLSKVSVIIPTVNRAESLEKTLISILNQKVPPMEIVIVDDSASEETKRLCDRLKNDFSKKEIELIYLKNSKKASASVARNLGIEGASTDAAYFLFLDDDVLLPQNYLDVMLSLFHSLEDCGILGAIDKNLLSSFNSLGDLRKILFLSLERAIRIPEERFWSRVDELIKSPEGTIEVPNLPSHNMLVSAREVRSLGIRFDETLSDGSFHEDFIFCHEFKKRTKKRIYLTMKTQVDHKMVGESYFVREFSRLKMNQWIYGVLKALGPSPKVKLYVLLQFLEIALGNMIRCFKGPPENRKIAYSSLKTALEALSDLRVLKAILSGSPEILNPLRKTLRINLTMLLSKFFYSKR